MEIRAQRLHTLLPGFREGLQGCSYFNIRVNVKTLTTAIVHALDHHSSDEHSMLSSITTLPARVVSKDSCLGQVADYPTLEGSLKSVMESP